MTRRQRDVGSFVDATKVRRRDRTKNVAPPRRETVTNIVERPRRRGRGLVKFSLAVVLTLATLAVAGEWVLRQSYFRVQHVTFVGVHHESLALVMAASGLESHPTMMDVSSTAIKENLAQFMWIDHVTLVKHWPNTVVVTVKEGTAVAVAFGAKHVLQYVDVKGRDLGPAPLHANLPTLRFVDPLNGTWPFEHAGRSAAYVASQLPPAFAAQVSVITEDDHGRVELTMTTPVRFILGPATQLHAKFVAIASVIAHTTLSPGDVVDATVPDELAVTGPPPS
ncbi:MAG TPA: FtsQ-type POTRA domain-containing protein [Acidimicrobiales bacterium]